VHRSRSISAFSLLAAATTTWAAASTACVSQRHYNECVSDAAKVHAELQSTQKADAAQVAELQRQLSQAQAETQERDAKLSDLSTSDHNHQAQLDEATAINQQLRDELERMGKDVDKMLAERGTMSKALEDAKARLEELRKAQAAADARAQLFRDFAIRFKPLIDAGQLRVESRRGELVMEVQGDLLFDEGKSDLRSAGKGALMEIARALQTSSPPSSGRRFLVTADVDVAEPKEAKPTKRSRSSWELTAARAVSVVEYLVSVGVPPASLTAAAAGAFDPIAASDDAPTRAKNRRVELALLPSAEAAPPPAAHAGP
jgi:chemotaxis protein MotB